MSLPGELERRESPVRSFFEERFPERRSVKRHVREQALGSKTIRPSGDARWGTIGAAFDYRCRLCFMASQELFETDPDGRSLAGGVLFDMVSGSVSRGLNAGMGAQVLQHHGLLAHEQAREFFLSIREAARAISGRDRRLPRRDEEDLCRRCFALALLEEVARGGLLPGALLTQLPRGATVDELLGLADAESVRDLRRMAWRFYDTQQSLLVGEAIVSPVFEGARDVGDADPDLIVDRCLIEIKTAVDPARIAKSSWPWQLLGYALLDYSDRYELDSLALYLARQGLLVRWPLDEYTRTLAGHEVSLAEARRDLQRALA